MEKHCSMILIGPAFPYRGGISETQHQFASALVQKGYNIQLWTFTTLYPRFLFPGSSQYSSDSTNNGLNALRKVHAYNPKNWKIIAQEINYINPQVVVFRYYTPYLSFCYWGIMKYLNQKILRIGFVDNWIAHEKRWIDGLLNQLFGKGIDKFSAFSENVASEIASSIHSKPIWYAQHPIAKDLPPKMQKTKARKQLGWNVSSHIVLFYGIIRKYKGLDLLLKSLSRDLLDSKNIELKIVGDCYQKKTYYRHLIQKKNLEQKIQCYFEFADQSMTQLVFSAADLLVLPYRSTSQSGIIPLSYHYDLPLVVSNVKGIAQIIQKDQTGFISENFPNDISQKIVTALQKENLIHFKTNISRCKKSYDWDDFTEKWLAYVDSNEPQTQPKKIFSDDT